MTAVRATIALVLALLTTPAAASAAPAIMLQDDPALSGPGGGAILDDSRAQASWVRAIVFYGQPLERVDRIVTAARARGYRVMLTISGAPSYAAPAAVSYDRPDANLYHRWAREIAARYRGRVAAYTIWNEPNHPVFLADTSGATYRRLWFAGSTAVRAVDPGVRVLAGNVCPCGDVVAFLEDFQRGRAPILAQGFAIHPYQTGDPRTTGTNIIQISRLRSLARYLQRQRRTMRTRARRALPIYITEFGYQRADTSPEVQVRYTATAYALAARANVRTFAQYGLTTAPTGYWDTRPYDLRTTLKTMIQSGGGTWSGKGSSTTNT